MFFLFLFQKEEILPTGGREAIPVDDSHENPFLDGSGITADKENLISPETNESSRKLWIQQLSQIQNEIKQMGTHFQKPDSENENNSLSVFKNNILPSIEKAKKNSGTIEGNIIQIYNISENLSNTAQKAFDLSEKVHDEIKTVNKILNNTIHETEILSAKSIEISKILEIMSNLSSNIHVLSINASIVSARAGIHGKGFEVVAKEIRKLAEETDSSLKDIDEHVNDIQNAVSSVDSEIKQAKTAINQETETLTDVEGSLRGVLLSVEIVNTLSITAKDNTVSQSTLFESMVAALNELTTKLEQISNKTSDETSSHCDSLKKFMADMDSIIGHIEL